MNERNVRCFNDHDPKWSIWKSNGTRICNACKTAYFAETRMYSKPKPTNPRKTETTTNDDHA